MGLCWGAAASLAQSTGQTPRVGILLGRSNPANQRNLAAFEQNLRARGWIPGQSVILETRSAEGKPERYAELLADLLRLKVSVIVVAGEPLIRAAQQATAAVPIVMAAVGDPVGPGFAKSLARPGGNITGVSNLALAFPAKWLELLKQTLPRLARVAVLRNLSNPGHDAFWRETETAAMTLGIGVVSSGYRRAAELEAAIARASAAHAGALLVLPDPLTGAYGGWIAELAVKHRLPTVFPDRDNVAAGGLMSYGIDSADNYRIAAGYVDRILRGADPAELPIEQGRQFVLAVNLKTAKALGIAIPEAVLLRADEAIR
jgi:putative ABC transport system substrate-binding protein